MDIVFEGLVYATEERPKTKQDRLGLDQRL